MGKKGIVRKNSRLDHGKVEKKWPQRNTASQISRGKQKKFDHKKVEAKWQKKWLREKINHPSKMLPVKNKHYNLYMFPYPSAEGLHAGHAFSSTGSDIYGRYMRMKGKNVFQPFGYDSFGIHSENFAIKIGEHPKNMLKRTIANYEKQMKSLGHGYDWTRTVTTSEPDYYRWTQWLFVQMFKAGLAYRKEANVNFCPSCKTVLADEQVIDGKCERCGHEVELKKLAQWFFRITDYADKLLNNLEKIDWPERIKLAQRNWIGRSEGAEIEFLLKGSDPVKIKVFTTRPDTLYGATFFVLSPDHPVVASLLSSKFKVQSSKLNEISKYVGKAKKRSKEERMMNKQKFGVFTGLYVVNPATKENIPVYVADYVLMDYGTGAIMGVPAHDQRDWDFAKVNKLKIKEVIAGGDVIQEAYDGEGKLINSGNWNSIKVPQNINKIVKDVEKRGWGRKETSYHLRDWLISRQRYWGPPIPMIFCQTCADNGESWHSLQDQVLKAIHKDQSDWEDAGWWPVEDKNLPVELPHLKIYKPRGTGRGPLADHPEFYETDCPHCGAKAERETDVSDTFLDSSWYFLRYPSVNLGSTKNKAQRTKQVQNFKKTENGKWKMEIPWDPKITRSWLPVDQYFGGAEHSVLHLMYARFMTQVLFDLRLIKFDEPFPKFYAHGLLIKDGAKMSKSRGNIVVPDIYVNKFGADTLRLYLMFMGPMDGYPDFRDEGIEGMQRFTYRVWDIFSNYSDVVLVEKGDAEKVLKIMHQTIKKVTKDIQEFKYNTAISALMEYVNELRNKTEQSTADGLQSTDTGNAKAIVRSPKAESKIRCSEWNEALKTLAQLIAPFAPHLAEEVWVNELDQKFSIHKSKWPEYSEELIKEDMVTIAVQVNGKLRSTIGVENQESKIKDHVLQLAKEDQKIKKWVDGKKINKEIFVPGKLVNFVI